MKYIFQIHLKPEASIEDYVEAWKKGSAIIQKQPGALGTRLHRKIDDDRTLLAIAEWESLEARDKAMAAIKKSDEATLEIVNNHENFATFERLGSFEHPDWEVLP